MAYALVTGGSSGIGRKYAEVLAQDYHYDLLIVSIQQQELEDTKKEIEGLYGVKVQTLYQNLAEADAAEKVYQFCEKEKIEVEVLINNAGLLNFDAFARVPSAKIETLLMVHVVTMTKLCRLFGTDMIARQKGYILNMSSMSAWMAMPSIQVYTASKAYVLSFSKALWYEFRPHKVRVLAVTPGSTDTGLLPFSPTFGKMLRWAGITMAPEKLVKRALKVLFKRRKKRCMPGAWNYIIVPIINHLPDWMVFTAMKFFPMFK